MNQKITVYVPATIGNQIVDNTDQVNHVADALCEMFGGATAVPVKGYWKDLETGELVEENTIQVYAFTTLWKRITFRMKVINLMKWIKLEMRQQMVALEINGNMKLL
jgi:hypothetical protein